MEVATQLQGTEGMEVVQRPTDVTQRQHLTR